MVAGLGTDVFLFNNTKIVTSISRIYKTCSENHKPKPKYFLVLDTI